jgi:hypothetical protein
MARLLKYTKSDVSDVLSEKRDRRGRAFAAEDPLSLVDDEPHGGSGGPDEAAAFIAEIVTDLARLAQRHRLDMLGHLLRMAKLEAEEHVRLHSKSKLS